MRTLAIGDIHGCSRALDVLLEAVRPGPDDRVIALGDYVDRGPDSSGVIQRLLALAKTTKLIALLGNHDEMMLEARDNAEKEAEWLNLGGRETLASYSVLGDQGKLVDVPDSHWEFLKETCVDWFETEKHLFVHANLIPDMPLEDQPLYLLRWEKLAMSAPHMSGKIMICGHTAQKDGLPLNLGFAVCIDTWVYGQGWLTCLDVDSGQIWQANQEGELRRDWLNEVELQAPE